NLGKTQEEVERSDRVPCLQAHRALQVSLGLRAEEAPVFCRVHFGPLLCEPMNEVSRELNRIGVAQHVPLPDDAAHPRQLDAHRLKPAASAAIEPFLASCDLFSNRIITVERQAG